MIGELPSVARRRKQGGRGEHTVRRPREIVPTNFNTETPLEGMMVVGARGCLEMVVWWEDGGGRSYLRRVPLDMDGNTNRLFLIGVPT